MARTICRTSQSFSLITFVRVVMENGAHYGSNTYSSTHSFTVYTATEENVISYLDNKSRKQTKI